MGTLRDNKYYDTIYARSAKYNQHYSKSHYFPMWQKVVALLPANANILEIGCGTGQFAQMLQDAGVKKYAGFDFSTEAVRIAREMTNGQLHIEWGDALNAATYTQGIGAKTDYNTIVTMEVFEHTDDLRILANVKKGATILLTVPDFDDPAHVRHFKTIEQVRERYAPHIDIQHLEKHLRWYILKGLTK